jgi:hypothetical protein
MGSGGDITETYLRAGIHGIVQGSKQSGSEKGGQELAHRVDAEDVS